MKNNYEILLNHNKTLAKQCIAADAMIKTHPRKAAVLYGQAMETFMAVICCDNDIAFDRPKDLTSINMIGVAYSYGVISKYEKEVLDDIRYFAYMAQHPKLMEKNLDTRTVLDKVIRFYGIVMRYYHLENESYSEDALSIGNCNIISILKDFEMDTAFDKVYLGTDEDSFSIIAQYIKHRSPLSDEVFAYMENADFKKQFSSCGQVLPPEVVPSDENNDMIFVKTVIPSGYVKLVSDDFLELYTEQRLKYIEKLAMILYQLHFDKNPLSLGGFTLDDLWISYKNMTPAISGIESRIGMYARESLCYLGKYELMDVKSFAVICACLFPEYEEIPVAGLLIKHALLGSEKAAMDKICALLKKEAKKHSFESKQLKDISGESPYEKYQRLQNGRVSPVNSTGKSESEPRADEDFDEMYNKIFS
ncbi:MAG: hypothetical protein Q8882_06750 [Bacillota bacterium]|nr:hypothetical protein [Bacillota bacterium]